MKWNEMMIFSLNLIRVHSASNIEPDHSASVADQTGVSIGDGDVWRGALGFGVPLSFLLGLVGALVLADSVKVGSRSLKNKSMYEPFLTQC